MTYGLVMIVKDAAHSIEACLASVAPHISSGTIIDTGSSDDTIERVKALLPDAHVEQRPWVNFGHNRTEAFALARNSADWLLALDADMTIEIDPDFEPDPSVDCYLIQMSEAGTSWRLPLVLRGDLPWLSRGAVHEYTALSNRPYRGEATDKIRVTFPPTPTSAEKRHWHASMLEEELARDPDNPRTIFYLAQTYREMGDPRARDLYIQRAQMIGFEEEGWYAQYRAALLAPWPRNIAELTMAWERRPYRLEPLYALVTELNLHDAHRTAYALAYQPNGSGPPDDVLFIEPGVWEWGMTFQASIAAWWVGEREEFERLTAQLLAKGLPPNIRAQVQANARLDAVPLGAAA